MIPLMLEPPVDNPEVEPISSVSKMGSEAVDDIIDEQLPTLPDDSMIEAYTKKKQ